jgi:hypothetical protein
MHCYMCQYTAPYSLSLVFLILILSHDRLSCTLFPVHYSSLLFLPAGSSKLVARSLQAGSSKLVAHSLRALSSQLTPKPVAQNNLPHRRQYTFRVKLHPLHIVGFVLKRHDVTIVVPGSDLQLFRKTFFRYDP